MTYLNPDKAPRQLPTVAGSPTNGTSDVQTLTITGTPTGGTFKLKFKNCTTAAIAYNAAAADVQTALRALNSINGANVNCSGGALPGSGVVITFAGKLGKRNQSLITVVSSALTGGSSPAASVAHTTPGVDATLVGSAGKGEEVQDSTNGRLFVNQGTADAPSWVPSSRAGVFISTEQTGTGSSQNIAHGLGVVPSFVFVAPTDTSPATTGAYTVTEGTHDATNVVVTVTSGKKFKVMAFV